MSENSHSHSHSHSHDPEIDGVQTFSDIVQSFEQYFSKIGAILNLLHLLVLTRKSMMTSSVNAILIGIALCDFLTMSNVIRAHYFVINPLGTDCTPPPTLVRMNIEWFLTSFQNGLRRCSSWLAVLIALVRYLVISRMLNQKIASPHFGFALVFGSILLSTFFSVLFFSEFHFGQIDTWHPEKTCSGYDANWSQPIFGQLCNELYEVQEGLFHRIQLVLEGIVGKLVPCIMLPILTGLLLYKLKKSHQTVAIVEVSVSIRHHRSQHKDRMTSIVIFIAITFLITEFPLGIVYLANAIWHHDDDIQAVAFYCLHLEFVFSKLGAFLNVFHLIVLCQKSMRTSSTNIIMIGIAICDFVCMNIIIRNGYVTQEMMELCTPPRSLTQMRFDWFLTSVHNGLRRCSAWLAMLMAVVRYRVISDVTIKNGKYSTPSYGWKVTQRAFFISFLFTLLFYFHVDIVEVTTWQKDASCKGPDEPLPIYSQKFDDFFEANNAFFSRARLILEGIFAKLIPCFTLTILSAMLLIAMRKSQIASTVEISVSNKNIRKSRKERTTILIVFIALSFFISESQLGIVDLYKGIWRGELTNETLAQNIVYICDAIFTINASIHCLIFFAMSFQYRKTVWKLVGRFNCYKIKKQSQVATVFSSKDF